MQKKVLTDSLVILIIAGLAFVILIYFNSPKFVSVNFSEQNLLNSTIVNNSFVCSSNSDCVPASCCHPNSCITKNKAPVCKNTICTQVCAAGTLDCEQGSCACRNKECTMVLK